MFGKKKADNLSVEELEKALLLKRRQARLERFQRMSKEGHATNTALVGNPNTPPPISEPTQPPIASPGFQPATVSPLKKKKPKKQRIKRPKTVMDYVLLSLEVGALLGLVGVLIASYFNLRELNDEVSLAQQAVVEQQAEPTPTTAPPIALASLLPGGHTPPTAPGGAVPDIPPHLQRWVQPPAQGASALTGAGAIEVDPQQSAAPTRLVIPKINVNAPIAHGVTWDDLKKGVGHLPGSANPGERGNMYLAAHNDIYGEIFRYLEDLEIGDEYFVYAGEEEFRYVVKERRIIEPTEVEVMLPTTEPVATLQTCYPYLVDTHRLVVIGELAE